MLDWPFLIRAARDLAVMPLLSHNLRGCFPELVPETVLEELRGLHQDHVSRSLYLTGQLLKIVKRFESKGIPVLPYKGPALADLLYGHPALRHFSDLDLLIRKEDIGRSLELLTAMGFRPEMRLGGAQAVAFKHAYNEITMLSADASVLLELQWAPVPWSFCFSHERMNLRDFPSASVAGSIRWPSLPPEELLLVLCVHGTKDGWDRLSLVCDIAELIRVYGDLDWDRLMGIASMTGGMRMLALGLVLSRDLLGATLPREMTEAINRDPAAASLARHVERRLFGDASKALGISAKYLFYLKARERLRDRVGFCMRLGITNLLIEWRHLGLPDYLLPFYYLSRPLRLFHRHGEAMLRQWCRRERVVRGCHAD